MDYFHEAEGSFLIFEHKIVSFAKITFHGISLLLFFRRACYFCLF